MSWFAKGPVCPIKVVRDEDGEPSELIVPHPAIRGGKIIADSIAEPIKACYAQLRNKGFPEQISTDSGIELFNKLAIERTTTLKNTIRNVGMTRKEYDDIRAMIRKAYRESIKLVKSVITDEKRKTIVSDYVVVLYWQHIMNIQAAYFPYESSNAGKAYTAAKAKANRSRINSSMAASANMRAKWSALSAATAASSAFRTHSGHNPIITPSPLGRNGLTIPGSAASYGNVKTRKHRRNTRKHRLNSTRKH
jgi:hypothetical protein